MMKERLAEVNFYENAVDTDVLIILTGKGHQPLSQKFSPGWGGVGWGAVCGKWNCYEEKVGCKLQVSVM